LLLAIIDTATVKAVMRLIGWDISRVLAVVDGIKRLSPRGIDCACVASRRVEVSAMAAGAETGEVLNQFRRFLENLCRLHGEAFRSRPK
jgi:hypothetical protein